MRHEKTFEPAAHRAAGFLLEVEQLSVAPKGAADRPLLSAVSLSVARGRALGIVGESGCGKSLTCLAIMGLLPTGLAQTGGRLRFDGQEPAADRRGLRGRRMAMIFQDPGATMNPLRRIGPFLTGLLGLHRGLTGSAAQAEAVRLLDAVGIPSARARLRAYPHELSGGQNQRVMIAGALAGDPDLLLADEPTTALDVTTQAQILDLLTGLRRDRGMSLILVSHDFGVIATAAEDVAVVYAGRIVEHAETATLLRAPRHPYTHALLSAIPPEEGHAPLRTLSGQPPAPGEVGPACPFAARCPAAAPRCRTEAPVLSGPPTRQVACHFPLSAA